MARTLNLNISVERQCLDSNACANLGFVRNCDPSSDLWFLIEYTDRFRVREELGVYFVHSREVVHVGKEDVDLDRLGKA